MHALESLDFYSLFHTRWFESVAKYEPDPCYSEVFFRIFPSDWALVRSGIWYGADPPMNALPEQGWKLHISVSTRDTSNLLEKLFPILLEHQVAFKFLLDPFIATLSNGKVWPRSAGGKFVTIYPNSNEQFIGLGNELLVALEAFKGPYILSDRRWPKSRCLFYRYGGFHSTSILQNDGQRTHVIRSPEGEMVPDVRAPYWNPPAWVKDPFSEAEHDVPKGVSFGENRFSISSALLFSNRGGVYMGTELETKRDVILKEARPCIEIGSQQLDAIDTLEKEFQILKRLVATGFFVRPITLFYAWEHAFLVEEFIPGIHLGQHSIIHNPIYSKDFNQSTINSYFAEMREVWLQLANAIVAAHKLGILLGDLSFTNVIVQDGRICICDLETATEEGQHAPIGLRTPGMFDSKISEKANDYYALGVIMFGCMILSYGIINLHPRSLSRFLRALTKDFNLPLELSSLLQRLVESSEQCAANPEVLIDALKNLPFMRENTMVGSPHLGLPISEQYTATDLDNLRLSASETVDGIYTYFLGTADTTRNDRLFPADLMVFETNPLSVSYGAMGVIHAMHCFKKPVPEDLEHWVTDQLLSLDQCPPGLYIGRSGIAWVLHNMGYLKEALVIVRGIRGIEYEWKSPDLSYGAAGYGLTCLRLWKDGGGSDLLAEAVRIGNYIDAGAVLNDLGAYWPDENGTIAIGYAHGGSGIALFLLYLSLATDDAKFLRLGRAALNFDLEHGKWLDGQFSGFPTSRLDPEGLPSQSAVLSCYWDIGSAGIGTTLLRYLAISSDDKLQAWLPLLVHDSSRKYTAFPQLFRGLAGLGNFLIDVWCFTENRDYLLAAWQAAEGVLLFRLERAEGIVFPGDQLRRESADFSTGSAGIGLFLHRLLNAESDDHNNFNFVIDELLPNGLRKRSGK